MPTTGNEIAARQKTTRALKTISEAAEILDVPQHVLRFWETKFSQIKPLKRSGGRRFYRPEDIDTLLKIKFLLYKQGFTIKGAQKAFEQKTVDALKPTFSATGKGEAAAHSNDNGPASEQSPNAPTIADIIMRLKDLSQQLRQSS